MHELFFKKSYLGNYSTLCQIKEPIGGGLAERAKGLGKAKEASKARALGHLALKEGRGLPAYVMFCHLLVMEEPVQLFSPSLRKDQEGSGKGSMTISHITRGEKGRMLIHLHL